MNIRFRRYVALTVQTMHFGSKLRDLRDLIRNTPKIYCHRRDVCRHISKTSTNHREGLLESPRWKEEGGKSSRPDKNVDP